MRRSGLADLVEPYAGRSTRALEISFVCMIVVIISMMFQIPDPATSTYLVFFAAKENSVENILTSIILIIVVTVVETSHQAYSPREHDPRACHLSLKRKRLISFCSGYAAYHHRARAGTG